jgi:uncharacterized RDD family membrane protein YckC
VVTRTAQDRDLRLQGHYAGFATRALAFVFDVVAVVISYDVLVRAAEFLVSTMTGTTFLITKYPVASWLVMIVWIAVYAISPVASGGRTLGMAIAGLRVVRSDGSPARNREATLRLLALPLCFLTLGVGFLLIVIRRDRRSLNDLIGGTAVVYGWDAHAARLRLLAQNAMEGDQDLVES